MREKRDNSTQASDLYEERLLKQRNLWEESAKAESTATAKELETLRNHNQQLEVCSTEHTQPRAHQQPTDTRTITTLTKTDTYRQTDLSSLSSGTTHLHIFKSIEVLLKDKNGF